MKATRPGQYVCFCPVTVPTQEGLAYIFLAIDSFSGYVMQTGVEDNCETETIIKHVYLLTEHKDFQLNIMRGFTLVFEDYQELAPRIKTIIQPFGKLIFDEDFHRKVCTPAINSLYNKMERR